MLTKIFMRLGETSKKVFVNAFNNCKTTYKTNLLLIDATSNVNKYGSENVVVNPEYRNKMLPNCH